MPELDYGVHGVPSKEEVRKYLDESQIYPLNIQAIGFELLKINRRLDALEK